MRPLVVVALLLVVPPLAVAAGEDPRSREWLRMDCDSGVDQPMALYVALDDLRGEFVELVRLEQ